MLMPGWGGLPGARRWPCEQAQEGAQPQDPIVPDPQAAHSQMTGEGAFQTEVSPAQLT